MGGEGGNDFKNQGYRLYRFESVDSEYDNKIL